MFRTIFWVSLRDNDEIAGTTGWNAVGMLQALQAADLELQRSIASLASSSRAGDVPTHTRAHAHASLSPRRHARSPNPVAVSPPPSPRRRSRGLSHSQASYSHSQDGSTTPHAARGHLRRDARSQSRGLSHGQSNHTPEVFRSGACLLQLLGLHVSVELEAST